MFKAKQTALVDVRGKQHEWGLNVPMSQDQIDAMREDGIEVNILVHTVPVWAAEVGLLPLWCAVQDIWNFRNPFRSKA